MQDEQKDAAATPESAPDPSAAAAPVEVAPDQLASDGERVVEGLEEGEANAG